MTTVYMKKNFYEKEYGMEYHEYKYQLMMENYKIAAVFGCGLTAFFIASFIYNWITCHPPIISSLLFLFGFVVTIGIYFYHFISKQRKLYKEYIIARLESE